MAEPMLKNCQPLPLRSPVGSNVLRPDLCRGYLIARPELHPMLRTGFSEFHRSLREPARNQKCLNAGWRITFYTKCCRILPSLNKSGSLYRDVCQKQQFASSEISKGFACSGLDHLPIYSL